MQDALKVAPGSIDNFPTTTSPEIFAIVSNPKMHPQIDGSKTVKGGITGPDHLKLGDTFYMHMSIGIP